MFNLKKRAMSTILAAATLIGSITIPTIVVHATLTTKTDKDNYAMYADIPGSATAFTQVDDSIADSSNAEEPVSTTVWLGGGNNKQKVGADKDIEFSTNGKSVQMYLYNKEDGKFNNITTAKGVLWAISGNQGYLDLIKNGNNVSVTRSTLATVARGKVTAGRDAGEAYVIAYKMKLDENNRPMRFAESEVSDSTEPTISTYDILAVAKIEVKQAAVALSSYDSYNDLLAYEAMTNARSYTVAQGQAFVPTLTEGSANVFATPTGGTTPLKKLTAATIGLNESKLIFVSAGALDGPNKKVNKAHDDTKYTVSIAPSGRDTIDYAQLVKRTYETPGDFTSDNDNTVFDGSTDERELELTLKELNNGFYVVGRKLAPTIKYENGEPQVTFKASKAVVTVTNKESGRSAKINVTVTNGVSEVDVSTAPATVTFTQKSQTTNVVNFNLIDAKVSSVAGTGKNAQLTEISSVTGPTITRNSDDNIDSDELPVYGKEDSETESREGLQEVVYAESGENKTALFPQATLVKPLAGVYISGGATPTYADFINTQNGKVTLGAKSNAADGTAGLAKAAGYKAVVGSDNSSVTLTIPKKPAGANPTVYDMVYLVVAYGPSEDQILIQPITITQEAGEEEPQTPLSFTMTLTADGKADAVATLDHENCTGSVVLADKNITYQITVDSGTISNVVGVEEITVTEETKITLTDNGGGEFTMKVDGVEYTITVTKTS